eukprot:TRINITY_DN6624_c0_g2_i1.p1 TRINITY_DN6624_c0_g2~~TRINITY_DN6624_c0_g2_i1.p1  ORF type:complete len:357 (-),score=21.12 TRINITY_DN6624_c0_g2_i1:161-1231(-)
MGNGGTAGAGRRTGAQFSKDFMRIMVRDSFKTAPEVRRWCWIRLFRLFVFLFAAVSVATVLLIRGTGEVLLRANDLGRRCFDTPYSKGDMKKNYTIAMVTCSDESGSIPKRSFQGLMKLVEPNKKSYARTHGYDFIDASDILDKRRPPSWSKILAVRTHLSRYDWVFWNDADSLVTNPNIALEDVLHSIIGDMEWNDMPDFIVTEDVTGVNAGMFFFRNSKWSKRFLDLWWNQTDFIRPFGHCKSGDNDALKHLIKTMPANENKQHVRIPKMQCAFNSNLWSPSWKSSHRLMTLTKSVWRGVYAKGDFMIHLAGLNDKKKWVRKILRDLEEERTVFSEEKRLFADELANDLGMLQF